MAKVQIQIVTWNSNRYIGDCLESIERQTYRDFSVLVIDNGSSDGTVKYIRGHFPTVSVLENFKNLGYAKANNQGIKMTKSEYILVLNPDTMLDAEFLETIIAFADKHPRGASFGGKTYKLERQAIDSRDAGGLHEAVVSEILDSTGLVMSRARQAINRGEGEKDTGQYDRAEEVFGLSGSCVLFRKQAIEEISTREEFFDQDFFAYKEDVDVAWRFRLFGWESWYVPAAVMFHYRTFAAVNDAWGARLSARRRISPFLRQLSLCNHYLMLIKNDHFFNVVVASPWIIWQMVKTAILIIFVEPFQVRSLGNIVMLSPKMFAKRRAIFKHALARPRDIRKWFSQ
jgi:GT2 family glycosyltransferase